MLYLQVKILKINLMAGIMIGKKSRINYIGGWQFGDTHLLTPGETLRMHEEIEGREYSDGCVYESYDYYLHITWKA